MMLPLVNRLPLRRRPNRLPPNNNNDDSNTPPAEDTQDSSPEDDTFYPSCFDVLKVRYLLQHIWQWTRDSQELLPVEIVDMIVDAAEYWASSESVLEGETVIRKDQDQIILTTVPLCYDVQALNTPSPKPLPHRTTHPCRQIIFTIASHDQGWGGGPGSRGQYGGSYSWFDTEVIHSAHQNRAANNQPPPQGPFHFGPDHPNLLPTARKLQSNKTAVPGSQKHTIVWHYQDDIAPDSNEAEEIERTQGRGRATLDGSQVRTLEIGDAIAVWGRARFGGWSNHVQRVSVRVFWAV
ncbi:hypothetical protein AAWM_07704 [Aspergillus awamori]|uniref:Uncharacterized protein n=1 Tax=Aspergillus awamori TaxID=105351 RepID=A0A401KZK4_ASPAW|nr:hypothetical protein AAWM_07704 [Aspergillus awamori]GKZ54454.1 hypothetical protein AnigIFM49718_009860 [Aspergillus niger]GKZ72207.1 hypothetical protein AnigIFM50267_008569 [Aspergillus niger]GLA00796.1 hypothetical protein AnigIFM60653_010181 [Aspergillus niger]GLA40825.1 hypothetical protein AnigIFM63309_008662 [Aspergillus niger]